MGNLKIMLSYPNFKWVINWEKKTRWDLHPYNLCLLSAVVDKKYDVTIADANLDDLSKKDFNNLIKSEKPDIIGISVLTNEYNESGLIAAKIAKKAYPDIITILGGVNATSDPMSLITDPNVDYVVAGEGEYVFKDFCDYVNGDKSKFPQKGIIFKKDGKIINHGKANFIENLDELPLPSYHKVDFMKYATRIQRESMDRPRDMPYARILTSRGCPYNCCFCEVGSISGKKARCRSPENIISEIEYLVKNYKIKYLIIDDDNFLIYKERAVKCFQLLI